MKRERLDDFDRTESVADRLRQMRAQGLSSQSSDDATAHVPLSMMPVPRREGGHWAKGFSPNPGGRPRNPEYANVVKLARECTVEAIETLVEIMLDRSRNDFARIAAANSLLDRGWGRRPEMVSLMRSGGENGEPQVVIRIGEVDANL